MAGRLSHVMTGEVAVSAPARSGTADCDRVAALFDAHHQRLYALARRLSSSADAARDLVQETFLRAARAPGAIPEGAGREEAWLVRVLVNLCRDQWRQSATRRRLHGAVERASRRQTPDAEAALVARVAVRDALSALPPRRRAVLVMHELEGQTTRQIARTLGVTEVTVRWHLARGRRDLRRMLGD